MKSANSLLKWGIDSFLAISLPPFIAKAQDCASLPAFPTNNITTTQDRDQMLCQLGLRRGLSLRHADHNDQDQSGD